MAERTEEELQRIADGLFDFAQALDGVAAFMAEWDVEAGVVSLGAATPDPDALRVALAERYGDAVVLEWAGPDDHVPRPTPFDRWTLAEDDRTITVYWLGGVAEPLPLKFRETPDAVEVLLQELSFVGASVAVGIGRRQTGVLPTPLAGRDIIDGALRSEHHDDVSAGRVDLLERALAHFAARRFPQANRLFDRLEAEHGESWSDPALARKRRIAAARASREREA